MQNCCKGLCLLLACLLLAACTPQEASAPPPITFTDSAGHTVTLTDTPTRVAVLFSSLADIWVSAGGSVAVTVGETVERGIVPAEDVILVDGGAGKTIDTEQLIAAAPELVICSADVPAQSEVAALLRTADIPVAECRVESFADYLAVLQQFTAITRRPDLYAASGTEQAVFLDGQFRKMEQKQFLIAGYDAEGRLLQCHTAPPSTASTPASG